MAILYKDEDACTWINSKSSEQRDVLLSHLRAIQANTPALSFNHWAVLLNNDNYNNLANNTYIEKMAKIAAMKGMQIEDLYSFCTVIESANK